MHFFFRFAQLVQIPFHCAQFYLSCIYEFAHFARPNSRIPKCLFLGKMRCQKPVFRGGPLPCMFMRGEGSPGRQTNTNKRVGDLRPEILLIFGFLNVRSTYEPSNSNIRKRKKLDKNSIRFASWYWNKTAFLGKKPKNRQFWPRRAVPPLIRSGGAAIRPSGEGLDNQYQ